MVNHFNRHIEGIDLDFWHDLIESRGELVTLNRGDSVCRVGKRTNGQYPQLEQDVSQKEIAEYLQITPTHLSRIRKELLGIIKINN